MDSKTLEHQFRSIFSDEDNVRQVIEGLGMTDPLPLLFKYKGLDSVEQSELKTTLRGKLSRERNPVIIKRVLEKDTLASYIALSQVLQYKACHVWEKLLPFARGAHGRLVVQPALVGGTVIQPAAMQPAIVWLCPDEMVFKLAEENFGKAEAPLKSMIPDSIKYYELPYFNDIGISVWLCRPPDMRTIDMYKLYQTYNKTKCFLLTGYCETTSNDPKCRLGDICVSKPTSGTNRGFVAALEHRTIEWIQSNDKDSHDKWLCPEGREVVFGRLGESCMDNNADFVSRNGYSFHKKSEEAIKRDAKMQHLTILMVTKTSSGRILRDKCDCKQSNSYHLIQYSYQVIKELADEISLKTSCNGFEHYHR